MGIGVLTAVGASLCCIAPILAIVAGTSSMASSFSWIEPFRHYLIAISIVVLAFAWFKTFKHKPDCDSDESVKTPFIQTKLFLLFVTLFAAAALAFPYYTASFYPEKAQQLPLPTTTTLTEIEFNVEGMTCAGCESHVNSEVNKLAGIFSISTSYEKGTSLVKFDNNITNEKEILAAIKSTGYKANKKESSHEN